MRYSDLRMWMASWWAGIFGQTRLSRVGEGTSITDTVRMADPDGTNPEEVIELTRLEQFGDVVIPPAETNAVIWRKSDGGVSMSLGIPNLRPTDCKQGDRALYCSQLGSIIKLHGANSATPGLVEMKTASGASSSITLGGDAVLIDKTGGSATMSGGVLTVKTDVVADVVYSEHFAGRGGTPTALAGAAVGGGNAFIFPGSSDSAFILSLVVSMGAPGPLATIQFAKEYDRIPQGIPAPGALTPNSATPPVAGSFYLSNVATDQIQVSTTTTLPDGNYLLSFVVVR